MAIIGMPTGETSWQISLEDPRNNTSDLAILQVKAGALATSSVTRRTWMQGDQPRNHIIDPRYGESVQAEWLSVSVYAPRASLAEAFAKSILIAGPELGPSLAARVDGLMFIAVQLDGSLWGLPQSKEMLYVPKYVHTA